MSPLSVHAGSESPKGPASRLGSVFTVLVVLAGVIHSAGCKTPPSGVTDPPPPASPRPTSPAPDDKRTLFRPGDILILNVFQEPSVSGEFVVSDSGGIRHPLLGQIFVKGFSTMVVESLIEQRLKDGLLVNPVVSVEHRSKSGRKVVINGEVMRPGIYEFTGDEKMTLTSALARAGGFTNIARRSKVRVIRTTGGVEQTIPVDVDDLFSGKLPDIVLLPDDKIFVPESTF